MTRTWQITWASIVAGAAGMAGAGGDLSLDWHTLDGGGGTSTGGDYTLSGTIGQPDAGEMSGGAFALAGGFWLDADGTPACSADIDRDRDVGFNDLVLLLDAWGPCPGTCPEDLDDSGDVDFTDLVLLLDAWGPCP